MKGKKEPLSESEAALNARIDAGDLPFECHLDSAFGLPLHLVFEMDGEIQEIYVRANAIPLIGSIVTTVTSVFKIE